MSQPAPLLDGRARTADAPEFNDNSRAQSLYAAVSGGIAMGLAMLAAGALYQAYAGGAFLVMAGLSAGGLVLALVLLRAQRRAGERTASK